MLSELSPNLAMILVPDFFLTRLVGTIYRLEGLNKGLILMYVCITCNYLCNLFAPRTPSYYFRNAKANLMLPKLRKSTFSYSGALPEEIRTPTNSLGVFKRSSYEWFSDEYSHTANMENSFEEF